MSGAWLVLTAMAILLASGIPGFLLSPRSPSGQRSSALLMAAAGVVGLFGLAASFAETAAVSVDFAWGLPWGRFVVGVDAVSAIFLALVFVVPALGSIYGLGYWPHADHPQTGPHLVLFQGLLAASMVLVVVARDAVLFLIAWEVMALAAYFAATVDDDDPAVRRAGWIYLIATHVGTLCLIAMFALWRHATGSFALAPAPAAAAELATPMFVLAVIGFGAKAGLMPLHVWLPGAHAGAPSHVSAVMSGVMLKMGVYGIVRMTMLLPVAPTSWGSALLVLGAISGVAGIALAIGQHDLKRLLAYSSIENIGIISMGLGLALLGRSMDRPDWVALGLGGALLHVCNHGLFKSLLFLGAGAVLHATHTRDMDQLGGLARRMPKLAGLFVVGAIAICGLPPLNGFAGEWLLYLGALRTLDDIGQSAAAPAASVAVVLAMIGALAVACFVKLLGTVFLGSPRSNRFAAVEDPPAVMLAPMVVLASGCVLLGLFPTVAVSPLENAIRVWSGAAPASAASIQVLAPLQWISALGLALAASAALLGVITKLVTRAAAAREAVTWDCGYAQPTARMQYTGSSLARTLVIQFRFVLWPRTHWNAGRGLFPATTTFKSVAADPVLERVLLPLFRVAGRFLPMARVFQQGQTQAYVLYVLITLIVLLLWEPVGEPR